MKKLILASGSPRRAELLERMGLSFTVQPANTEEILQPGLTPQQQVVSLSRQKAEAVLSLHKEQDTVILSADTVVVLDGKILGKPADPEDAKAMLRALSGRSHLVLTGVTVASGAQLLTHCEETEVYFRELTEAEIARYVATGEPMDKAGAYGIQGLAAMFIPGIRGDYYNVMGLPVCATAQLLQRVEVLPTTEVTA